ncbi:hypothetical protein TWF718_008361 [Orbilia javanica]|uniref:Uncharacterized protein n=1 Tax=Orbilia javanica TaxID=47235 RepID=A0AAN8NU33_9PEZI
MGNKHWGGGTADPAPKIDQLLTEQLETTPGFSKAQPLKGQRIDNKEASRCSVGGSMVDGWQSICMSVPTTIRFTETLGIKWR